MKKIVTSQMPQVIRRLLLVWKAEDIGFKSRADQISLSLPTTRHRCNFEVWALVQYRRDGHRSLVTLERLLSEYNEDLI